MAEFTTKLQDFDLPQSSINRIIKSVLPENAQVTKDARAAFTRAAAIFIFYITHCANDICKEKKRSTIYTQDIIAALREIDFQDFAGPLEDFIEVYRREGEAKRNKKESSTNNGLDEPEEDAKENNNEEEDYDNDSN